MLLKIGVVQPKTFHVINDADTKNLETALAYIDQSIEKGCDFVVFPETYPGPWKKPIKWSPIDEIAAKAKEKSIYVLAGTAENVSEDLEKQYIVQVLIDPSGKVKKYRRTSPRSPWIYAEGHAWDLNYKEADELPIFQTEFGCIGVLLCSEVYVPELARVLALKGAEITFMPAGTYKQGLINTWRTLIYARAIENLMFTVTTQNIFGDEDGLAMVASPEDILLESQNPGIYPVKIDLERVRYLRKERDHYLDPLPYKTKPGLLSDQWRRPELYKTIIDFTNK